MRSRLTFCPAFRQPHTVTKALAQDAAINHEVFCSWFHLDAVRLLVRVRQTGAVSVDDQVLKDYPLAVVAQDEDMPVTGSW